MPSPLAEISSNPQRPRPSASKSKMPSSSYAQLQDENSPIANRPVLGGASPRYMHSTVASSSSKTTTHSPVSRLPVRAKTPTSVKASTSTARDWANSAARHIGLRRVKANDSARRNLTGPPSGCKPTESNGVPDTSKKPLPSPPVAQVITSSPLKSSLTLLDAADPPLRRSPGTPDEENWPTISPKRLTSPDVPVQTGHRPVVKKFSYPNLKAENSTFTKNGPTETGKLTMSAVKCGSYLSTKFPKLDLHEGIAVEIVDEESLSEVSNDKEPKESMTASMLPSIPVPSGQVTLEKLRSSPLPTRSSSLRNRISSSSLTSNGSSNITDFAYSTPTKISEATVQHCTSLSMPRVVTVIDSGEELRSHRGSLASEASTTAVASKSVHSLGSLKYPHAQADVTDEPSALSNKIRQVSPSPAANGATEFRSAVSSLNTIKEKSELPVNSLNRSGSASSHQEEQQVPAMASQDDGFGRTSKFAESFSSPELLSRSDKHDTVSMDPQRSYERNIRTERPYSRQAGEFGPTLRISTEAEKILLGELHEDSSTQSGVLGLLRSKSGSLHKAAVKNHLRKSFNNLQVNGMPEPESSPAAAIDGTTHRDADDKALNFGSTMPSTHAAAAENLPEELPEDTEERNSCSDDDTVDKERGYAIALAKLEGTYSGPQVQDVDWGRLGQELHRSLSGNGNPQQTVTMFEVQYKTFPASAEQSSYAGDESETNLIVEDTQAPTESSHALHNVQADPVPEHNVSTHQHMAKSQPSSNNGYPRPMSIASVSSRRPSVPPKDVVRLRPPRVSSTTPKYPQRTSSYRGRQVGEASTSPTGLGIEIADGTGVHCTPAQSHGTSMSASNGRGSKDKHEAGQTEPQGTRKRSRSKSRLAITKLQGLFHKREAKVPEVPPVTTDKYSRKVKVTSTGSPMPNLASSAYRPTTASRSRATPTATTTGTSRFVRPRIPPSLAMESPAIDSPEPTGVAETTRMALAIMEQSHTLPDGPEKERMLNIAKIMVDAVSSAKQAQKSMIEAEQAAKEARLSFLMTQKSIVEMAQMIQQPGSIVGRLAMGRHRRR